MKKNPKHNKYLINFKDTIQKALLKLSKNKYKCLIVIDSQKKIVGTLTDGDIRRYLINKPQINTKLMSYAKKDVTFLHCLPRGSEVSEKVFLGKNSKVWLQALNRVHVQKSILLYCFGKLR